MRDIGRRHAHDGGNKRLVNFLIPVADCVVVSEIMRLENRSFSSIARTLFTLGIWTYQELARLTNNLGPTPRPDAEHLLAQFAPALREALEKEVG